MPKYYCDYCDTYLTHDSPSVRKTHCSGRKHKENVRFYYQKWMEERAQSLIDATSKFKCGLNHIEILMIAFFISCCIHCSKNGYQTVSTCTNRYHI